MDKFQEDFEDDDLSDDIEVNTQDDCSVDPDMPFDDGLDD